MIAAWHYDLALINATLPDMSGIVLATIAASENIPVLLMSGDAAMNLQLERHGFPYMQEPFGSEQLIRVANQVIRDAQMNILKVKVSAARMQTNTAVLT
jgi:DNA-binding response OmpR family regulator